MRNVNGVYENLKLALWLLRIHTLPKQTNY
jgi:hypothetical protein